MCGVVGLFDRIGKREINRAVLDKMNESQFHRGPDEGGTHVEPGVGFGHRRLSIIDLSSGKQPLSNDRGDIVVTYNGEIFNFKEIRAELIEAGYQFKTNCDTEVIVYAWDKWQQECVQHFRGMFAFAIWDRARQVLFLARDRLGVKPLYYSLCEDGFLVFASELKALRHYPGLSKAIDMSAVEDYFAFGYIPDPKSIYTSVRKLEPGCYLLLRSGDVVPKPVRYWDVPFNVVSGMTEAEASEQLMEHVREAVRIRMVADVPLGAFLSGGVDSSAVVAMMAGLSESPVNTCAISFGDPKYNEAQYAKMVADRYHTHHSIGQVDPEDFSLLDRLVGLYDEPFADSSALPTYRVCELARKNVTVALSGDGGDENLAGYRRYRWHVYEERVRGYVPGVIRRPLFGALGRIYPKADWAPKIFRAKSTLESFARDSIEGYFHGVSLMGDAQREKLFSSSFLSELGGYRAVEVLRAHAQRAPVSDPLSLVQYLDIKSYLPGDILTKVDRASMAHALEVRVPLLDHKLVEWISSIPADYKLRNREGKYLFKKALERYLPNEILYRPKMGFAVPVSSWFRGALRERVRSSVLGTVMADSGLFDMNRIKTMVSQHESGITDHGTSLWSLLIFESFLRQNC